MQRNRLVGFTLIAGFTLTAQTALAKEPALKPEELIIKQRGICLTHPAPTDCGFGLTFLPG